MGSTSNSEVAAHLKTFNATEVGRIIDLLDLFDSHGLT